MQSFIVRRLLLLFPVLFGITVFSFLLLTLTGDPCAAMLGEHYTPAHCDRIRAQFGLDDPLPVQYLRFVSSVVRGDMGRSIYTHNPVVDELKLYLPATIELTLGAMVVALVVGLPVGVTSAERHNSAIDLASMFGALIGVSMPIFWLGLMLSYLFAFKLGWFPTSGRLDSDIQLTTITNLYVLDSLITFNLPALENSLKHLFLPAIALGTIPTAIIARITRSAMLDVLGLDYIRTARAKGLQVRAVVYRHALRNALLPVVTVVGLQFGSLLAGAVLTETIFAWPGIGRWSVNAILGHDFPVVQIAVITFALVFVTVNLIVDVSYGFIDPRIRVH